MVLGRRVCLPFCHGRWGTFCSTRWMALPLGNEDPTYWWGIPTADRQPWLLQAGPGLCDWLSDLT